MPRQPQQNEPFDEPPFEQIPDISRMHAQAMETMDDDIVWVGAGMHQVIVYTVGRRSGNEHKVVLPVWFDADGHRIVVASYAGAPTHPHWYLNLCDKDANPAVRVLARDHEFWAAAHVLEGDDYAETWDALTTDRTYYRDYQTRTARRIPLVRLVELPPA
jgi:deazaflavin-dependent oxidoreductase (nitroreductase family)